MTVIPVLDSTLVYLGTFGPRDGGDPINDRRGSPGTRPLCKWWVRSSPPSLTRQDREVLLGAVLRDRWDLVRNLGLGGHPRGVLHRPGDGWVEGRGEDGREDGDERRTDPPLGDPTPDVLRNPRPPCRDNPCPPLLQVTTVPGAPEDTCEVVG